MTKLIQLSLSLLDRNSHLPVSRGAVTKLILLSLLLFSLPSTVSATDSDNDGIDDELENTIAAEFLPLIYFNGEEQCPEPGVLLYHVRPYAPEIDSVISVTYVLLFYDDCGSWGHKGDAESFALTLFEDPSCSNGFRVHSLRTYAHEGVPLCEEISTATIDRCDFGVSEGDTIYVSNNKHALYRQRSTCNDPDRWFCDDACEASMVMHNGSLVYPGSGQSWYMYNVGEPDYPIIEDLTEINGGSADFASNLIWDYSHFCGDEEYSPGDDCPATIVDKLFNCSSGPSLPVEVSFTAGGAVPSPMGFCRNQFLYLDLPYGGNVVAHIYSTAGDVTDKVFLPYFCPTSDLTTPYWDGVHMHGYCAPPGSYYLFTEAFRGDNSAQSELIRFGIAGDEERPRSPANLVGTGNSHSVSLSWQDRSSIEEAYLIERSFDTCPYRVIAVLPENTTSYTDTPFYEGLARYRVFAHRTFGGNSGYSNETTLELRWDLTAPFLRGTEAHNPHTHTLRWHFDPGTLPFNQYILYKRFKHPQLGDIDQEVPPEWSSWIDIYYSNERQDTLYTDTLLEYDICYEYRVEAIISEWTDTLTSNVKGFHNFCEEGGCPVLFVAQGERFERITNLFPAIERLPAHGSITDIAYVGTDTAKTERIITLKIEEVDSDTSYLDQLTLLSLSMPDSLYSGILTSDRIILYDNMSFPLSAIDSRGVSGLSLIARPDGVTYSGVKESELILDFDTGEGVDSLLAILTIPEDPPIKSIGPILYARDKRSDSGDWIHVHTFSPHQNKSVSLVNCARYIREQGDPFRVKLENANDVPIDCVFMTREHSGNTPVEELELLRAVSSSGHEMTAVLSQQDELKAVLENGEHITLYYKKPDRCSTGTEYYIRARGYYVRGDEPGM